MLKSLKIANLLEKRIQLGDYTLKKISTERELALQTGVSRVTTRKAIQYLIERKVLAPCPNGQLEVNRGPGDGRSGLSIRHRDATNLLFFDGHAVTKSRGPDDHIMVYWRFIYDFIKPDEWR